MGDAVNISNRKRRLRNILLPFLATIIFITVLFVSAGNLAWIWGWILAGIMIVGNVVGVLLAGPGLHLEDDYSVATIGQLRTRIQAFLEMIG